ncbi:MAG: hypothetical protein H6706_07860 [Myxococcales bacterium]|nr:hypothetical protein [Myxococcales bacterium]
MRGAGVAVDGSRDDAGWYAMEAGGLVARAAGGPGPEVQLRLRPQGDRFLATVSSRPFGTVFIDGRDVGPTPAAALPLRPGRRVLVVRTEAGATELSIEVAP